MKQWNRICTTAVALALSVSCVGSAFAAGTEKHRAKVDETAARPVVQTVKTPESQAAHRALVEENIQKSFRKVEFQPGFHGYADEDTVRAIVLLEGDAAAQMAGAKTRAGNHQARLAAQHRAVQMQMADVDYTLQYDFTTLLNGMSIDVAYGDLDRIAALPGVKDVYLANRYEVPKLLPPTDGSSEQTGAADVWTHYRGQGQVIAVLDSGLDTDHEAFQNCNILGDTALSREFVENAIQANTVAPGQYLSEKIPFVYDYFNRDTQVLGKDSHGTHVTGIATGYVEDQEGAVTFTGAAPGAQLLFMKVFPDPENSSTTADVYFRALEDAYLLGADVVNLSLGSRCGFTYDPSLETEVFGNIYETMEEQGIVMCVAAGNDGSQADNSMNLYGPGTVKADYAEYGEVGSPSTYADNSSVASVDSLRYPSFVFSVENQNFIYTDSNHTWAATFGGQPGVDYVMVPGLGDWDDFDGLDLTGKIAVIQRGVVSFQEKIDNAEAAGAVGVIVYNNVDEALNMQMALDPDTLPAIFTTAEAGAALAEAEIKTVVTPSEQEVYEDTQFGGTMSEYSSWGTTPELTFKPTITSVGGNVYSTVIDGYEVISGTSMATPNLAGITADLLQALEERGVTDKVERMNLAKDLLESSAKILLDENELPYSPRRQGAGLGNVALALQAYEKGAVLEEPLVELCDDVEKKGEYVFDLNLRNYGAADVTYTTDSVVLRDAVVEQNGSKYNTLTAETLDAQVTFDCGAEVTVPAKGEKTVRVKVKLSDEAKAKLDADFANGGFVEGYVTFTNEESAVHGSFMGFYGDWTKDSVLEDTDFRDVVPVLTELFTTYPEGSNETWAQLGYSYTDVLDINTDASMAFQYNSWAGEANAFAGDNMVGFADYKEQHIAFSTPDSDGRCYCDSLLMVPQQLRNAEQLTMTVFDKKNPSTIYYVKEEPYVPKAVFVEEEQAWLSYTVFSWDGSNRNDDGRFVPSGTEVTIRFDAKLPYRDTIQEGVWTFDATVDYIAPVIEDVTVDREAQTISVTASDAHYIQGMFLSTYEGTTLQTKTFSADEKGESCTAVFDYSNYPYELSFNVGVLDYASNQTMEYDIFVKDVGQKATLTYHTAEGSYEYIWQDIHVGDEVYVDYAPDDMGDNLFECWTDRPYEMEEDLDRVYKKYYPDYWDKIQIKGDTDLYALYSVCHTEVSDPAAFEYMEDEPNDWTEGEYGIIGLYRGEDFMSKLEDTYVLGSKAEPLHSKEFDDYYQAPDYNAAFYTNREDIVWTVEETENWWYALKNQATGQYLAGDPVTMKLYMTDEIDEYAEWWLTYDPIGCNTEISMANYPDLRLLFVSYPEFDREIGFRLFDNTVEIPVTFSGQRDESDPAYRIPEEYYYSFIYNRNTEELVPDYYTTDLHEILVNTSQLRAQIEAAEALNQQDYISGWDGLEEALDKAKEVLANQYASQEETDEAAEALKAAMEGLVEKPAAEETIVVKAVVDGDKSTAETIFTGKAPKGVGLVEWLNENVKVEDREGYAVDKWYNWDWFGHKHSDKSTVNGWTNVYVTYTKVPMVNVVVKSVLDGDKSTAKTIWTGKAPKGANLVDWLTEHVTGEIEVAEGYDWNGKWMNYDWFGHGYSSTVKFNGWTNVYVNFTEK